MGPIEQAAINPAKGEEWPRTSGINDARNREGARRMLLLKRSVCRGGRSWRRHGGFRIQHLVAEG